MAFEDILFGKIVNPLEGIPDAIKSGFEIAAQREQIANQAKQIENEQERIRMEFADKAVNSMKALKDFKTPAEKKFYFEYVKRYAAKAGMPIPEGVDGLINASPETQESLSSYYETLSQAYPGIENAGKRSLMMLEKIQQYGGDPTTFKSFFDADGRVLQGDIEQRKAKAAAEQKDIDMVESNLDKGVATQKFREALKSMPLEQQKAASGDLLAIKEKAKYLRDKAFENKNAFLNDEGQKETIAALDLINSGLDNPAILSTARQKLDELEKSFIKYGVAATGLEEQRKSEEQKIKAAASGMKLEQDIFDSVSKTQEYKDISGTVKLAGDVINVLNSDISGTYLGRDMLATFLAKYYDPKTGVKEAEVNRLIGASRLGKEKDIFGRVSNAIDGFFNGAVLNKDARDMIAIAIKSDIEAIAPRIDDLASVVDSRVARYPGTDGDIIKKQLFGKYERLKSGIDVRSKIDPMMSEQPEHKTKIQQFVSSFYKKKEAQPEGATPQMDSAFITGAKSAAPSAAPSPAPSAAPSAAPAPSAKISGLMKLFPEASAPAPQQSPAPKDKYDSMTDEELFKLWNQNKTQKQ